MLPEIIIIMYVTIIILVLNFRVLLQIINPTCTCPPNYKLNDHDKCECVANAPCSGNQRWNRHTCQCESKCIEVRDCNANQIWNSQTCRCDCLIAQLCGANMVWNSDTCSCDCHLVHFCGPNQWWNSKTCTCECAPIGLCNENQVWNRDTCSCECRPDLCPFGSFMVPDTCLCIIEH